jgi:hypothetical protein
MNLADFLATYGAPKAQALKAQAPKAQAPKAQAPVSVGTLASFLRNYGVGEASPVASRARDLKKQVFWQDSVHALRPRARVQRPEPKEPVFGLWPVPSETVSVSVQLLVKKGKKKRALQAYPTGVLGLVVHPEVDGDPHILTVTHTPSGMAFATGLDMEVQDAIRVMRAFAAMHPSIDFSLPANALLEKVRELGKSDTITKDFADLVSQGATCPSVGARKLARKKYDESRRDWYSPRHVTAEDIIRAFDTPGRMRNLRSNFVDVFGFRYYFGWEDDRLVPMIRYAHHKQGDYAHSDQTRWDKNIEAALRRFLARLTDERHRVAEKESLPLFYRMPRVVDAPETLTAGQMKKIQDARVMSDDARTKESGKQAFALDGRLWVTSGYSYSHGNMAANLYEVVPASDWSGPVSSFKQEMRALDLGVMGDRPVPGVEVFLKGQRYVYTGRSKQTEGPDPGFSPEARSTRGSSARHRAISFPMFEGYV